DAVDVRQQRRAAETFRSIQPASVDAAADCVGAVAGARSDRRFHAGPVDQPIAEGFGAAADQPGLSLDVFAATGHWHVSRVVRAAAERLAAASETRGLPELRWRHRANSPR